MRMMKEPVLAVLAAAALSTPTVHALIVGPYSVDANTVQLWSFDEAAGSSTAANDVGSGVSLNAVNITGDGTTTTNTGILGASGFTGFGNAANIGADRNDGLRFGTNTTKTTTTALGIDNAFTMEALINTSTLTASDPQEIISMESQSNARPFQFVITTSGDLRFHGISSGSQHNVAIPTTGADAFVANEWFHVAVTYNGNQNTANNMNFYWTRLDATRTEANLIGSFQFSSDLNTGDSYFTVGNDARVAGTEPLKGLIDEVRLSNVARDADQMMFAIPEPSSIALIGIAALTGLAGLRRRR